MKMNKITSLFGQDEIQVGKKKGFIRFDAQGAEHICDNYSDPSHGIKHTEIRSIIKTSGLMIQEEGKKSPQILAKFKGAVYQIPVFIHKDSIFIKSAYKCSNHTYRLIYNFYFP